MPIREEAASAVCAARKLFVKYQSLNNLSSVDLESHLHPVPMTRNLTSGWSAPKVSSGLLDAARSMTTLELVVELFSRPKGSEGAVGALIARDSRVATIMVADGHNHCWGRFVVAKELCHFIQGTLDASTMSSNPDDVINLLSDLLSPDAAHIRASRLYEIEVAAYFGAIEMLLPKELQPAIDAMINRGDDLESIAKIFRVPQLVVEARYKNDFYRGLFEETYKTVKYSQVEFFPLNTPQIDR